MRSFSIFRPLCQVLCGGLIGLSWACVPPLANGDDWPQFRGPNVDGVAQSECPVAWEVTADSTRNVRWQVDVAGEGWSGPIVWGEQVFLTAAIPVTTVDPTATRPEAYSGGGGRRRDDLTETEYRYEVICLNARSGETAWRQTARSSRPPIPRHSSNTFATETPVTDGQHVFAYFGMAGVYCFDMQGNLQWEKDLGVYEMRAGWGTSSSPVLFDGKLFLQIDNEQQSFITALDAKSGRELWRSPRDEASQYSAPIIWQNSQRNELIAGGMHTRSYDLETGRLLWELDMAKGRSSATPIAVDDRLYVGTEYRNRGGADDGGGFLFAVKPGGQGDITPADEADSSEFIAWNLAGSDIQMASPAICKGHLYLLERRGGNLHCINAETGETAYRKRIRGARAFWASPWTSGDRVYCLDSGGTTFVIKGGAEFELLRTNVIDEQAWSSPAVADGALFLRTIDRLYCIDEHPGSAAP